MTHNETPIETIARIAAEIGQPLTTVDTPAATEQPRRPRWLLKINGRVLHKRAAR